MPTLTLLVQPCAGCCTGACCVDFECLILTESECDDATGTFSGVGTDCGDIECDPLMACCIEGSCSQLTYNDCIAAGGYVDSQVACEFVVCEVRGACCQGEECALTLPGGCIGDYLGDNTSCEPNPCLDPTGACCVDEVCSITTEALCAGTYQGDASDCDPDPCAAPTGACCIEGICTPGYTEGNCIGDGGTYQNDGSDCDPDPC